MVELIGQIWSVIDTFVIGYFIVLALMFLAVVSLIIFVVVQMAKGRKEFNRMKTHNEERRRLIRERFNKK